MNKPTLAAVAAAASAAIGTILSLAKSITRAGYESAAYEVLDHDGNFEVRQYAVHMLAETPMSSRSRDDGGFGRLFRYISGDNTRSEKIAMTTPVFVARQDAQERGSMAFVMPERVVRCGAPESTSERVALRTLESHRVASLRFRGYRDERRIADAEKRLRAWIAKRNLAPSGWPRLAYYDPPWTPGPLRRNEIQIAVAE